MTIEEFEKEILDVAQQYFAVDIKAEYKAKSIAVNLAEDAVWFFASSTTYDDAMEGIITQIKAYMEKSRGGS
ncbi:hypothetical protein [Hydrogenimonas sp.]